MTQDELWVAMCQAIATWSDTLTRDDVEEGFDSLSDEVDEIRKARVVEIEEE